MIKTYISALLVVLIAGAQISLAQESLDDVLSQLDDTGVSESTPAQNSVAVSDAVVAETIETSDGTVVEVMAPAAASPAASKAMSEQDALFRKGIKHYQNGDYDKAQSAFEAMLFNDKYDSRANLYLKRTAQRIAAKELRKQSASRASAIAEINAAWNQEPSIKTADEGSDEPQGPSAEEIAVAAMKARLESIVIPSLDFREANIEDVVAFLSETCRRLDSQGKGINMLLVGMDNADGMAGESSITISIREMNLFEALGFITEMAELKFEIKPRVVQIMPIGYVSPEDLKLTSYDIIPEVGANMESFSGDNAGGGVDDLFGSPSASATAEAGPVDVSAFFSIVEWPVGASAVYQPRFHKLFVKNTPNNTKALESVLSNLEQEAILKRSQQVRIETRFIEFNEGALQELGFDWTLYDDGEFGGFKLGSITGDGTYYQRATGYSAQDDNNGNDPTIYTEGQSGAATVGDYNGTQGQSLFGLGQRSSSGVFSEIQSGVLSSMGGVAPYMTLGMDGKFPLDLNISAMEQDGTADVLSAPEVTTKSGNEAILRVVEVHRYPQDYDVETGQRTAPVVKPQDWEEVDLGVVLKVTPVVDAEANTIDLDLQPEVKQFRGYDDYVVGYNAYESGGNNTSELFGDGSTLYARMPFFETRSVQTQVTVADGQTIVMGGLKNETTETFSDRVPLLGDIPYVGRLFRTEGSRSEKKNLTIIVKATQVDDHGLTRADREEMSDS